MLVVWVLVCLTLFAPSRATIGGKDADEDEAPYYVALQISLDGLTSIPAGGALITDRHVLTAAHIFKDMSRDKGHFSVELRHGDHVVKALQYKHVTLHPNFGVGLLGEIVNDLAVIQLPKPVTFNGRFRAIPLHTNAADDLESQRVRLYGLGRTNRPFVISEKDVVISEIPAQYPSRLQVIRKEIAAIACETHWNRIPLYPRFNNREQMCLKNSRVAPCIGDSGGPVVLNNTLVGVVSFGNQSCDPSWPSMATRVAYHANWIHAITNDWSEDRTSQRSRSTEL